MHKVCIVDDEELVRKSIKNRIERTGLDFMVIGEAEDAEQAIHIFHELKPRSNVC